MPNLKNLLMGEMPVSRVYEKGKVTYPQPVKDGLLLWYDFLGRKNTDANKGISQDLSGNGNDAPLMNFAFAKGSGYERGLVSDGIDDYLTLPLLTIPTDFSLSHNGETTVYMGSSVKVKGRDGILATANPNLSSKMVQFASPSPGTIATRKGIRDIIVEFYSVTENPNTPYVFMTGIDPLLMPNTYTMSYYVTYEKDSTNPNEQINLRQGMRNGGSSDFTVVLTKGVRTRVTHTFTPTSDDPNKDLIFFTYDRTNRTRVRIEDIKVELGTAATPFVFHREEFYPSRIYHYGKFQELKFYNRPLTDAEMHENYLMEKERWSPSYIPVQDGLETWYDFRKNSNMSASKSLANDLSGNGYNGTLTNFSFTEGSGYNSGLVFDGTDDFIKLPLGLGNVSNTRTNGITIEVVYQPTQTRETVLVGLSPSTGYSGAASGAIGTSVSGAAVATCFDDLAGQYIRLAGTTLLELGKPHYLTMSFNPADSKMRVYANGVEENSIAIKAFSRLLTNGNNNIGVYEWSNGKEDYASGKIQTARIYNKVLSAGEILHNYNIEKEKWKL